MCQTPPKNMWQEEGEEESKVFALCPEYIFLKSNFQDIPPFRESIEILSNILIDSRRIFSKKILKIFCEGKRWK